MSFDVEARKLYADGQGHETEAPLDEAVEVGAFSVEPGRAGYTGAAVIQLGRQQLKSGRQTVTLVLAQAPKFVGIDPFNTRIDRNSEDNLVRVDQ